MPGGGGPRSPLHRADRRARRRRTRDIAGAEAADGFGGELEFGHRHQIEPAQAARRCAGSPDRSCGSFPACRRRNRAAPARPCRAQRVEDAAAHRVFAGLAHGRGAHEAVELEPFDDAGHAGTLPGATDSDCSPTNSRAGTRCSAALTVVSSTDGRSRPLMRASRDSAVMRWATTPACGDTRS